MPQFESLQRPAGASGSFLVTLHPRAACRLHSCRECPPARRSNGAPELGNRSVCAGSLNSPFTAADEKIPLSVVRVNNKPQHLVFCCHFAHPLSKHRHLPVESFKQPCASRVCAVRFALKSGQRRGFKPGPARLVPPSTLARAPAQGAELVQLAGTLCELWRFEAPRYKSARQRMQVVRSVSASLKLQCSYCASIGYARRRNTARKKNAAHLQAASSSIHKTKISCLPWLQSSFHRTISARRTPTPGRMRLPALRQQRVVRS